MSSDRWDAVVVGAGPNGLVAANVLTDAGWRTLVLEAETDPGGAVRTAEFTAPGFRNDLFSAFYPLAGDPAPIDRLHLERWGAAVGARPGRARPPAARRSRRPATSLGRGVGGRARRGGAGRGRRLVAVARPLGPPGTGRVPSLHGAVSPDPYREGRLGPARSRAMERSCGRRRRHGAPGLVGRRARGRGSRDQQRAVARPALRHPRADDDDRSPRSPSGTESAWAYTHVPEKVAADGGRRALSGEDVDDVVRGIEQRVEDHAPGFRDLILARHVLSPAGLQARDANLVAGDMSGGTNQLHQQLVFRPFSGLGRPSTPVRRLYLASSSAHPVGGVHGACGTNAARAALAHRRVAPFWGRAAGSALHGRR
jgi:phytoene dehydrogenase-like protein